MNLDQKAEMRKLRDEIAESLISALAHLKVLGFGRQGRSWKRTREQADGNVIDMVEFELTGSPPFVLISVSSEPQGASRGLFSSTRG